MILNKHNLVVAKVASKGEVRSAMNCLRITSKYTEATNGHCLARVTIPNIIESDFPSVAGFKPTCLKLRKKEVLVSVIDTEVLKKSLRVRNSLSILSNCQIDFPETKQGEVPIIRGVTITLDSSQIHLLTDLSKDNLYPDSDKVLADAKNVNRSTVRVNAKYLLDLVQMIKDYDENHYINIDFPVEEKGDKGKALIIRASNKKTGQAFTGLLMPVRVGV